MILIISKTSIIIGLNYSIHDHRCKFIWPLGMIDHNDNPLSPDDGIGHTHHP
jgi:hypothetical protein